MNDFTLFLDLPFALQFAVLCFVASVTGLSVVLLAAPKRNCFFLKWPVETRILALLVSPSLLILWPFFVFDWILKCRGIDADDLDFDD